MTDIDWKRTLKEIEREYDGLPPAPSLGSLKAKKAAEDAAKEAAKRRRSRIAVFFQLVPVVALSVGLAYWPYEARCGLDLAGYLSAIVAMTLGGVWVGATSWQARLPLAHVTALLILAWAAALTAREVLPRVGYAKPDPARIAWRCAAP
jgi:hypothetical protein